ncbi:MAG: bifunctional proline dehydrogenase/L-glutamate gamma-semialdehyde dehydrogenase PutA [Rhizobiaceae bacterium]
MAKSLEALRGAIRENIYADEAAAVTRLSKLAALDANTRARISGRGADLVRAVRASSEPKLMEAFLAEYGLSTNEGVALMCLAEALLRVPDAETIDELIADKIVPHDWSSHSGESASMFVNASTWALMLTGRVLEQGEGPIEATLFGMIRRLGEPVIRTAVGTAMREMGDQFVLGQTIKEAVSRGKPMTAKGYLYSYDMLGEAARTHSDADRYFEAYRQAIRALKRESNRDDIRTNPGISVKLSALHPRYEEPQRERMLPELSARLLDLCQEARDARMGLNIDAEEADRLDLSLDVIETVLGDKSLAGWEGFGVVVQAYGPRAPFVIDWLHNLAERLDRKVMVRLVKGAYWDTEIKRAQVLGLEGFPVFTRKCNTDISYLACARKLLGLTDRIYPQFATHNAHTAAAILEMAEDRTLYEFQRLHGMGDALHEEIRKAEGTRCRIYAPVGAHEDLLAYLVRRLLENGANSSFVHQIVDEAVSAEEIASDPVALAEGQSAVNPVIQHPSRIFGPERVNSRGWDIFDRNAVSVIENNRKLFEQPHCWKSGPIPQVEGGKARDVANPARPVETVGEVTEANAGIATEAIGRAVAAQPDWSARPVSDRAEILRRIADHYEENAAEFFALTAREAGKTLADGIAEVREAVDFLRYYANEALKAERDTIARGVIVCISPWNFPLAIFTGQIAAALVTGNAVIAKPAEQTPLIAARAVGLMLEAGIPEHVIQLLPGDGPSVGGPLVADPRIAGVCFTGSTEVAKLIEAQLANSAPPDAMLIAETGGLNAMIVDSTALPEQAVRDIVASSFQSAGQRCSALRILYVQHDVAPKVLEMLTGAMNALSVGDPWQLSSDVGPVIDQEARQSILDYCQAAEQEGRVIARLEVPEEGLFVAPHIIKVNGIGDMDREIFGPVLHVATFEAEQIGKVIDDVNARGYGLTFGLHTRIEGRVQDVIDQVHAGNVYVNRNQIGAIVGSQPFGGEGLSGTGPKAGGPHYLRRFRKSVDAGVTGEPEVKTGKTDLPKAFAEAGEWQLRQDRIAILRKALRGRAASAVAAAASLDFGPVDLPGPTGEANSLALHPRGNVLCLGPDPDALLNQTVLALAAGNSVIAVSEGARQSLAVLSKVKSLPLIVVDGSPKLEEISTLAVDAVAFCGSPAMTRDIRKLLAGRDGPIVRMISEPLDAVAHAHERAVCVDTTAAGGNASLLAAAG